MNRWRLSTLGAAAALLLAAFGARLFLLPDEEPVAALEIRPLSTELRKPGGWSTPEADIEFTAVAARPLSADRLARALPDPPPGWSVRSGPETPSAVHRVYANGPRRVEIELHDAIGAKATLLELLMPLAEPAEDDERIRIAVRGPDAAGRLFYERASRTGELELAVAKRYHLRISARNLAPEELHAWWERVDFSSLDPTD